MWMLETEDEGRCGLCLEGLLRYQIIKRALMGKIMANMEQKWLSVSCTS